MEKYSTMVGARKKRKGKGNKMNTITRREILPYVFLSHKQTDKFKTACLSVNLLTQLEKEQAAPNALLPPVLLRGTKNHPNMQALNQYLEGLYGAKIWPIIRKKGEIQCLGFFSSFVDDKFLPPGEGVFAQMVTLLGEILLAPQMKQGTLLDQYVDSEKEKLIEEIEGRINNKTSYALGRLVEEMCAYEDFSVFRLGTVDVAQEITAESLTERYKNLLESAPIEIFYSGATPVDTVEKALQVAFQSLPKRTPDFEMGTDVRQNALEDKPRYVEEEMDVSQGKLSLGFRLGQVMEEPTYPALSLLHYLYGGSVNSKLFLNVREKLSLCYYASSILEAHKGVLFVAAGIEVSKFQVAKDEILAQLQAIATGDITDDEFMWAKKALVTDLYLTQDAQDQLEDFYLSQTLLGKEEDLEEEIEKVWAVTKEEIIAIGKGMELDAVYFLKGNGGEGEA